MTLYSLRSDPQATKRSGSCGTQWTSSGRRSVILFTWLGSFDVRKCSETKNLWEVTNNTRSFSVGFFYYLLYKNTGSGLKGEHWTCIRASRLALVLVQTSDELLASGASGHFQNLSGIDKSSLPYLSIISWKFFLYWIDRSSQNYAVEYGMQLLIIIQGWNNKIELRTIKY